MLVSYKAIGRNIRTARTAQRMTQEQTADQLGISQLHFGRLERGERPASLEQLAHIAKTLDVPLFTLLNGCVIEEAFVPQHEDGLERFLATLEHIVQGVSPEGRRLMLNLCQVVAEEDRRTEMDAED